jgi:hypothetical protein
VDGDGCQEGAFIEVNKIMSGEAKKGWAKGKKRKSVKINRR